MAYISQIIKDKYPLTIQHTHGYPLKRSITPPKIRPQATMGRAMPQSLPDEAQGKYPQNSETGLRTYRPSGEHKIEFIYLQDLEKTEKKTKGINESQFVKLAGKEYIYKRNIVSAENLPENHEREIFYHSFSRHPDNQYPFYHSNSRVMAQIMSRDLLKLFVKNRDDIILPKIHPVVNQENGEVCGTLTEKIDFQEMQLILNLNGNIVPKTKKKNNETSGILTEKIAFQEEDIKQKIEENAMASLMKLLGIEDVVILVKNEKISVIKNIGITENNQLVFFDFGNNLIDVEFMHRQSYVDLKDIKLEIPNFARHSLQKIREGYLQGYDTKNGEDGLAETVHPEIEDIVMNTGPGDKEFRKDMAKIIQTRINNAFLLK